MKLGDTVISNTSHPAGGAWIEIIGSESAAMSNSVAPRRGCVDRNLWTVSLYWFSMVAPRRGCVDRNTVVNMVISMAVRSHPAGGAWIEIQVPNVSIGRSKVAPRRGCVDRNRLRS